MPVSRRSAALMAAIHAACAPGPASAEVRIGTFAGSEIAFEGLLQGDVSRYDSDAAGLDGDSGDGRDHDHDLRRAELALKGKGPGRLDWVAGYDAKAGKWLDVNARLRFGAEGAHAVQIGQFKQPNSLEELSSTRHNDFIAKATATNVYAVARRLGAGYSYAGQAWGASASWFGRELTRGLATGTGHGARAYWAPVNGQAGVLHLGISRIDQDTTADSVRLRARPNADLAGVRLVDSGTLGNADRVAANGLELLWMRAGFKLQGEYFSGSVDRYGAAASDYATHGAYLSGLWNLGGRRWGYRGGTPATPTPAAGESLWQFGLRYDLLDLDDGAVTGGRQRAWTAGVNWYRGKFLKAMLNYVDVDSERAGVADDPAIVEARLQLAW